MWRMPPVPDYSGTATCKTCGKPGLTWTDRIGRGWLLLNEVGNPHTCDPRLVRQQQTDLFTDLDEGNDQ
jgi:hypothetical protein